MTSKRKPGPFRAAAEAVYNDPMNAHRTGAQIVEQVEIALEAAHAQGMVDGRANRRKSEAVGVVAALEGAAKSLEMRARELRKDYDI